jgi:hypothetical protein
MSPRDGAHLGLGQLAEWKNRPGELVLAQSVKEVRLVLVRVETLQKSVSTRAGRVRVLNGIDPRVVAGRDRVAVELAQRAS